MAKDVVFCMTVVAEGKFFIGGRSGKGQVNIFLIFFCFFRMAASAIYIDETFPEMEIWIGICMAIHTDQVAFVVDILRPFLRINEDGAHFPVACDLGDIRPAVTGKAILISICGNLRRRKAKRED